MAKAQRTSFTTIAECMAWLPEHERVMAEELRFLVHDCVPKVKEKVSFQCPYFSHFGALCLIWPGSIDWMGVTNPGRVQLMFTKGNQLTDRYGYMTLSAQNRMSMRYFYKPEEINHEILAELIYAAADLNEELYRLKLLK